jgi:hypothetical protein
LACTNLPHPVRPPLTLPPHRETVSQKDPFPSVRIIFSHFLTTVSTIEGVLQRELDIRKFSRSLNFYVPVKKLLVLDHKKGGCQSYKNPRKIILMESQWGWVLVSIAVPRCLHEPAEVIPRTWQGVGAKQTMAPVFFTPWKWIVLDVLTKGSKCNQP